MELRLIRKYIKENYTIGHLYEMRNGVEYYICDVIEDKVRDLNRDGDLNDKGEQKIPSQTAIPYGRYEVLLTVSPAFKNKTWAKKYNGIVPLINNVPHFSGIRIHPGSSADSSAGCLIVGMNTKRGMVTNSVAMYDKLMSQFLIPAIDRGEHIYINIIA